MTATAAPAKRRIPFDEAFRLAQDAVRLLAPACQRICIAGSLRRKQATICDVELVVVPKIEPRHDLFGQEIEGLALNRLNARVAELAAVRAVGVPE